jgi:hypothetical protein
VKRQPDSCHLKAKERRRNQHRWHHNFEEILSCGVRHPVCGILLWEPKLIMQFLKPNKAGLSEDADIRAPLTLLRN